MTYAFIVALFTIPVAVVGLWLVNLDRDRVPKHALVVIGICLFVLPVVIGVAVEVF